MIEKMGTVFLSFLQKNGIVAVVILAVLAVRFFLRKYPKKYSYWLWAVVGIRMVFDLPFTSRFSVFNLFRLSETGAGSVGTTQYINIISPDQFITAAQNFSAANSSKSVSQTVVPAAATAQTVYAILFLVWIIGMVLVLSYGIYSYVKCWKLVRLAVILKKSQHLHERQKSSDGKHKKWRTASVWECDRIPSPFVLGVFRPQIYIPFGMEEPGQQYIIAHECCHIRRYDPLWKLLAFVLLAIYWWNPLAWAAFFYMVRDMEMSCDEAVIESFGNGIKKEYSESLLEFAMERHPYSFAPVAFGESDAGNRIKNVLNFKKPHTWVAVTVTILTVIIAVSCLTNQKAVVEKNVSDAASTQKPATEDAVDEKITQGIEEWAQAFCSRDGKTIRKLATKDVQEDLEKRELLMGEGFGWSSPWPWGTEENSYLPYTVNAQMQTAEILYYAMVSDPHVTVWKEILHYSYENGQFQVTQEELKVYDEIASARDYDDAYAHNISETAMDYRTNEMTEVLNEHATAFPDSDDPLLDPVQAARYLLNLSEDEDMVQLALLDGEIAKDGEVLVQITFPKDGETRKVKMIQPYGKDGIWIPLDNV